MAEQHLTEDTGTGESVFEFTIPTKVSYENGHEPSATPVSIESTAETAGNNTSEAIASDDATIDRRLGQAATSDSKGWKNEIPADTTVSSELEALKIFYTVTKGICDISDLLDGERDQALGGKR